MPEYFSHDYDTREDEKIIDMMADMGWAGYGLYWGIVELLYINEGKMRTNYPQIAFKLNSHPEHVQHLIENFGLFQIKKGFFTSKSIIKRLSKRREKSEVGRANAYKRWENNDANPMQTECEPIAIKGKKSKGKKSIFRKPTIEQIREYCKERNNNIDPEYFFDKQEAQGWVTGKNKIPIKDWKAVIRTWERFSKKDDGIHADLTKTLFTSDD